MAPRILIVELDRARAGVERALGEFVDRFPGVEIEHADVDPAEQRVGVRIFGIERQRLEQQVLRAAMIVRRHAPHVRQRLHHQVPGVDALRRLAPHPRRLGEQDLRADRTDHPVGDLVLQREDVGELAVVAVGPQMIAERRVDQLAGDAHAARRFAHAAFEDVAHAELARDRPHVDRAALVGE